MRDANFSALLANQKLADLLSAAGKQSIPYLRIHRRVPGAKVTQVTQQELQSIERYLKYPLSAIIKELNQRQGLAPNVQFHGNMPANEIFPINGNHFVPISTVSSRLLRLNQISNDEQIICLYKLGPVMTPGEVMSWTGRLKKLTSTRHRNILLRVAHGDIFSNARLARFGLRQDAACANCQEPSESIIHKIKECASANKAWLELEKAKRLLGLTNLTDLSLENLIGAKDRVNKIELALQAELIHKLTSKNETYCPIALVRTVVRLIGYSERLDTELKDKISNWLRN